MATFDLGRVTPLYKGDYSASASYELNDVVLYNGNLYWHIQATATVGILPTDTTVWKLAFADEGVRAEIRGYADDAQASKTAAAQSASQASASASNASASASQAAASAQSAQTAEGNASASASAAATSATNSAASAQSAASEAQTATDKATLATNKAQAASESASLATAKANAASTSETNAAASAQTATAKASEAAASATSAQEYDESAQQSAVNAQTAQGLAETAQTGAETAQGLAEDARDDAQEIVDGINAKASQIDANTESIATLEEDCYKPYATDTASGAIVSFMDGADGIPLRSLVVDINPVQDLSQGDPSPENICPISGWTGMTVNASGKNLLDPNTAALYGSTTYGLTLAWDTATGTFTISGTYTGADSNIGFRIITVPSAIRAYNVVGFSTSPNFNILEWQNGEDVIVCRLKNFVQNTAYNIVIYPFVYEGSTPPTDYEPYSGQTIPINWQTEAGTVYGGKLDVLTGVLTVYPYYASYNGETLTGRWISDRDVYAVGATPTIGAQVVNIGAEGTEIQLSPHEVKSLLGQNNIFADTGDSAVEYRADTKMYIERLTEPDADMIADANITSGSYFMVGNSLYLATSNIASGGQVIVGTNATRKSLSEALNEINQ